MNYDPNLTNSGRMARQVVRLTFGMWEYRKTLDVPVGGNCTGLSVIRAALGMASDQLGAEFVMQRAKDGEELLCSDDEDRGDEWLEDMLVGAEILTIEPSATGARK